MIVVCDNGHDFEMKLESEIIEGDIELVFFECPICKKRYQVTTTNSEIRHLQSRIEMLSFRASIQKDKKLKTKLLSEMNHLRARKKQLMEDLKRA